MKWTSLLLCLLWLPAKGQNLPALIPYLDREQGTYGYMNPQGEVLVPAQWNGAGLFDGGKAWVSFHQRPPHSYFGEIVCIIEQKGNYLIPPEAGWNGMWKPLRTPAEYYAARAIDPGPVPCRPEPDDASPDFGCYLASLPGLNARDTATGRWGLLDSNGRMLVPRIFDQGSGQVLYDRQQRGFFVLGRSNGLYGLLSFRGDTLLPFRYKSLYYNGADTTRLSFLAEENGRRSLVSSTGKPLLPGSFSWLEYEHGLWHASLDSTEAVFGPDGRTIIPPIYRIIRIYADSIVLFKTDSNGQQLRAVAGPDGSVLQPLLPYEPPPFVWSGNRRPCRPSHSMPWPHEGMRYGSKKLYSLTLQGRLYKILDNKAWHAPDFWASHWYLLEQTGYQLDSARHGIIDTLMRVVLPPQRLPVLNRIGDFVQCRKESGYVLLDSAGCEASPPLPCRVVAVLFTAAGQRRYLCSHTQARPEYDAYHHAMPEAMQLWADTLLQSGGMAVKGPDSYRPTSALSIADAAALRLSNSFYATDTHGKQGIIDADDSVQLPALSFRYPEMRYLAGDTFFHWTAPYNPFRQRTGASQKIRREKAVLAGLFAVRDEQGRVGYFYPDGRAPLPFFNFQYKELLVELGPNLFLLKDDKKGSFPAYRLLNSENRELLPGLRINSVQVIRDVPELYALLAENREQTIFATSDGRLYVK